MKWLEGIATSSKYVSPCNSNKTPKEAPLQTWQFPSNEASVDNTYSSN